MSGRSGLKAMLSTCQYQPRTINTLIALKKERLIPDKDIQWIDKKDQRLLAWVLCKLTSFFQNPQFEPMAPKPGAIQTEQRYDVIIGLLDLWPASFQDKAQITSQWKAEWAKTLLPAKKTKWLKESDQEQISWAYTYVNTHLRPFGIPEPINHKERYDYVLAALDATSSMHEDSRELALKRFSQAWSQQKHRQKAGAPIAMPMKENVRKMLEELAEKEGRPKYKVVELLIERAYRESTDPTRTP